MQCPVCQKEQVIVEVDDVELDVCLDGCGIWFDAQELRQLFEVKGAPTQLHDLEQRLEELPRGEHGPVRRCPRCRGKMRHVRAPGPAGGVILDRCQRGHGLWFDPGEYEAIPKRDVPPELPLEQRQAIGRAMAAAMNLEYDLKTDSIGAAFAETLRRVLASMGRVRFH